MCSISCLWTHLHLQSRPTSSLVDMKNNCFLVFNFHHQWKKTKWDCVNNIAIKMLAGAGGKAANSYGLTIGLFFSAAALRFPLSISIFLYSGVSIVSKHCYFYEKGNWIKATSENVNHTAQRTKYNNVRNRQCLYWHFIEIIESNEKLTKHSGCWLQATDYVQRKFYWLMWEKCWNETLKMFEQNKVSCFANSSRYLFDPAHLLVIIQIYRVKWESP